MLVRELTDGADLDLVLLVRDVEEGCKRDGTPFLRLRLSDRTGSVAALVWDAVGRFRQLCVAGQPVRVIGRYDVHPRHGAQIAVRALRAPAEGSFDPAGLCAGPASSVAGLEAELRSLIGSIADRHLRGLLDALLGPGTRTWQRFRVAPAAKHYHHAYPHGLLEHSLSVAQAVAAISSTFPGIDRDLAVTGALLHDLGKLDAYTPGPLDIQMTDAGRLLGEIPLGYYAIRRTIEGLPGFPEATAQALGHIVLAHHGRLEHGSPVRPQTREATLVHFCDDLGGRLGSFDRLERELPVGAAWAAFDRALGCGAYFPPAPVAAPPAPVEPLAGVAVPDVPVTAAPAPAERRATVAA